MKETPVALAEVAVERLESFAREGAFFLCRVCAALDDERFHTGPGYEFVVALGRLVDDVDHLRLALPQLTEQPSATGAQTPWVM